MGSANGTFIDGARMGDPIVLQPGSRLKLGETEIVVHEGTGHRGRRRGPAAAPRWSATPTASPRRSAALNAKRPDHGARGVAGRQPAGALTPTVGPAGTGILDGRPPEPFRRSSTDMPMREECKHFESRTYPDGETVRKCNLDLAPEAPWRCPDDVPEVRAAAGRRQLDLRHAGHAAHARRARAARASPSCSTRPRTSSTPPAPRSWPRSRPSGARPRRAAPSAGSAAGFRRKKR